MTKFDLSVSLFNIPPTVFSITWGSVLQKWFSQGKSSLIAGSNVMDETYVSSRLELELRACGYVANTKEEIAITEKLRQDLGIVPLSECIQPEEAWKEMFKLFESASGVKAPAMKTAEERIIWRIHVSGKAIQPMLQKQSKGIWTKGRNIALRTLFSKTPESASEQDIQIINHLKGMMVGMVWSTIGILIKP